MWYTLYDNHAKWHNTIGSNLETAKNWLSLPHVHWMNASTEAIHRVLKHYPKPKFGIDTIKGLDGNEYDVNQRTIRSFPFCNLIEFNTNAPVLPGQPPCFIVAPLSGHFSTLLRDTVRSMLAQSGTVYITDWANVRDVPLSVGCFGLITYVNYLEEFWRFLPRRSHIVAVCQPVVPVLIATSRMFQIKDSKRPLSMTLISGPVDARLSPTKVNNYATKHSIEWFERSVIDHVPLGYAGSGRLVYPGFLQYFGFVAMHPQRHAGAYQDFFKNLIQGDHSNAQKHREFYDEYNAVLDLDATYYLETVAEVFQKFSLAKNTMKMEGDYIDLSAIDDCALLTLEGEKDDIAGTGQTRAAHDLCSRIPNSSKHHWEVPEVGHYGIFSGKTFSNQIAPVIAKWQLKHE